MPPEDEKVRFSVFKPIKLLNGKVCERHFATMPFEFINDLDAIGYGNVYSCATAFDLVSVALDSAIAQC